MLLSLVADCIVSPAAVLLFAELLSYLALCQVSALEAAVAELRRPATAEVGHSGGPRLHSGMSTATLKPCANSWS